MDPRAFPNSTIAKNVLSFLFSIGRQRDRAHKAIKQIFYEVIEKRRKSAEKEEDILQTLIDATYKYYITHFTHKRIFYNTLPQPVCLSVEMAVLWMMTRFQGCW